MRFSDLLTMSVNNLFRRKLRTFLTVLGVVIGTASIERIYHQPVFFLWKPDRDSGV